MGYSTYLASVVRLTDVVDLPFVPDVRFAHDNRDKEAGLALQLDRWYSFSASVLDLRRRVRSDLSLFEGAGAMLMSKQTHLLQLEAELVPLLPRAGYVELCGALVTLYDGTVFAVAKRAVLRAMASANNEDGRRKLRK